MNLFESNNQKPLADRVRPKVLDDVVGQQHLIGNNQFLRTIIETGQPTSLILWGPPGTGKTTLARIIANSSNAAFEEVSAVTAGLPEVKKIISQAAERSRMGQKTILFVDEIHRFNKAQQDAFLPHVENGTIILIGATTENPSFEVINPLLSRTRVVVLESLTPVQLEEIIDRAVTELKSTSIEPEAKRLLANLAGGDARSALGGLEVASSIANAITPAIIEKAMQTSALKYDKGGDFHYNLISAYIKSIRGGAVDAALFYLARMLEAGEDPKFVARRLVVFASEDIGTANSQALNLAVSTFQAVERIGMPECRINLSHATIAMATSPKSRSAYDAIGAASSAVKEHPSAQPPLHLRNAPTKLMNELNYGQGYRWEAGFEHDKGFLPEELQDSVFYRSEDTHDKED